MSPRLHPRERRIAQDGFAAGRRGDPPESCPHPLQEVRESFARAVVALDGPQPNCWGGTYG